MSDINNFDHFATKETEKAKLYTKNTLISTNELDFPNQDQSKRYETLFCCCFFSEILRLNPAYFYEWYSNYVTYKWSNIAHVLNYSRRIQLSSKNILDADEKKQNNQNLALSRKKISEAIKMRKLKKGRYKQSYLFEIESNLVNFMRLI